MFASVSRNSLKAASAVAAGAVAVSVRVAFLWHEILAMTHCRLVFWRLDPFALPHRFASLRLFRCRVSSSRPRAATTLPARWAPRRRSRISWRCVSVHGMKIHPPPVAHPPCLAPHFPHVQGIKNIEHDLGITRGGSPATAVDPHGNFPYITDKHRSLTCKALKRNPELYAKYANVKVK